MATKKARMPFTQASHDKFISYAVNMAKRQANFKEFKDKLEVIDKAYYTYKAIDDTCTDAERKELEKMIETPMVISHVDSTVAYLSDVFLSGYPIFGVITSKEESEAGEQMEALMASHSNIGKWKQELLRFLLDGAKYNFHGAEVTWSPYRTVTIATNSATVGDTPSIDTSFEYINGIKGMDMYNLFWDYSAAPAKVSTEGDYIGYHENITRIQLKELAEELEDLSGEYAGAINVKDALASTYPSEEYFVERPEVAKYNPTKDSDNVDWFTWIGQDASTGNKNKDHKNKYLKSVMYVRAIPEDFGMIRPNGDKVQVLKLVIINMQHIIHISPVFTPNNSLPIYMGQPVEDGFGYQTKSLSEVILPWQDAASELLNARLASSRRAISDRAIYNPNYLRSRDVNSRDPAAKIPMTQTFRLDSLNAGQVYHQIPFDNSGTASLLGDMQNLMQIADQSTGMSASQQGIQTKGNRTLGEFQEISGNASDRTRNLALRVESQVMTSIKHQLKLNILMYAPKGKMLAPSSSKALEINPATLRKALIEFKLADGYTPKSKMVNPESFNMMLQAFTANPMILQDPMLFELYAYFGGLIGVPDMHQFKPTAAPQQPGQPTTQPGVEPNAPPSQPAV